MAGNALRLVISISASADSARSVAQCRVNGTPQRRGSSPRRVTGLVRSFRLLQRQGSPQRMATDLKLISDLHFAVLPRPQQRPRLLQIRFIERLGSAAHATPATGGPLGRSFRPTSGKCAYRKLGRSPRCRAGSGSRTLQPTNYPISEAAFRASARARRKQRFRLFLP
jgi:hypothetical protein